MRTRTTLAAAALVAVGALLEARVRYLKSHDFSYEQ
jgi:hypothetical protein